MPRESKIFQQLAELSRIVSHLGPNDWPTISLKAVKDSGQPYARLFRELTAEVAKTESAILRILFHDSMEGSPNSVGYKTHEGSQESRYRKTKSRLKQRLLNTLFVLNLENAGYSQYSQTLFSVNRRVFLSRVLFVLGLRELSGIEAKKGLPDAMKIEEWSCAMEFLVVLRADAAKCGDIKAHRLFRQQYEFCQGLLMAEQIAEVCVEELQLAFAKSGSEHPAYAAEAEKASAKISELAGAHSSFKLSFIAIRLRSLATQVRMDYRATEQLCGEAFDLLNRYPQFKNRARVAEYEIMGLVSAFHIRDEQAANRWIKQCQQDISPKEDNWFAFREYEYLHRMHSREFRDAFALVNEVRSNSRYDTQTEAMENKWSLFRMYAEFVNGERVPITTPADFSVLVPSFTADKSGLNTAMIILHVLLIAERKQFSKLRDRAEFIRGYRKRHLKGPENSQANRFFKMLEMIETCDLRYGKIVHKTETLLEELKESERSEPIQGEQILPFTWVWGRLMERLKEYHPLKYRADE